MRRITPGTLGLILILVVPSAFILLVNRKENMNTSSSLASSDTTNQVGTTPTPEPSPSASAGTLQEAAQSAGLTVPADAVSAKQVVLKTSKGDIAITLYPEAAPLAVTNFATLGKRGYYNAIIFHRVIKDFMIQAGDPQGTGRGGESIYGKEFPNEVNSYTYKPGTVGMANAGKDTNGSQFFIVTEKDQPSLNGGYTIFGQVTEESSMAVVRAIAATPTDAGDKPTTEVKITGFEIKE